VDPTHISLHSYVLLDMMASLQWVTNGIAITSAVGARFLAQTLLVLLPSVVSRAVSSRLTHVSSHHEDVHDPSLNIKGKYTTGRQGRRWYMGR
jgi:hypothetical protein